MLVSEIIDTNGRLTEMDRLEFHNGILIPGFDGLTIELLMKLQSEMSESNLNQIFKSIFPEKEAGFELGKKADVWLISSLDLQNLRLTAKSKLKKLV